MIGRRFVNGRDNDPLPRLTFGLAKDFLLFSRKSLIECEDSDNIMSHFPGKRSNGNDRGRFMEDMCYA
jgi:hypothetical protein